MKDIRTEIRDILKRPESHEVFGYRDITFFLKYIRPFWKDGLVGLMLTLTVSALTSLVPLSSKVFIDFILMKNDLSRIQQFFASYHLSSLFPLFSRMASSVPFLILGMALLAVAVGIAGILRRYVIFRFQQGITFHLQTSLFDHMLRFPLSYFRKQQTGYLMSRVSDDVDAVQYLFSASLSQNAQNLSRIVFSMLILFSLSSKLSIVMLLLFPLSFFINAFFARRVMSASMQEYESSAGISRDMQEVLSGIETVKSFSAEQKESGKVAVSIRSAMAAKIKSQILSLFSEYASRGAQYLTMLLVMWIGYYEIMRGVMTIGDYVAFASIVLYLSGPLNSVALFHITLQPLFASLSRLREMLMVLPETVKDEQGEHPSRIAGELRFEHVTFSYGTGEPVLRDVTFTVSPGQVAALVGPSGVGKSTLISLILKFYLPQSGAVLLDGRDIREVSSEWLRQKIGIVSQETFLFHDTVEKNIRYGNPDASLHEVEEAAQRARIHDEIEAFPQQYQTMVGERGARLSAGQRQRISIARAFLKNPPILILDEPTSALDEDAEKGIRESLKELAANRTTFIISHREALVELADKVLVLDNGELRESR